MDTINKGDFIELKYTGKTSDGVIFDTTDLEVAEKNELRLNNVKPVVICVGQNHILPSIDAFLTGKEIGKYSLDLVPEEAFGKKDLKKIQLVPASKFKKEGLQPYPGMQVTIDDKAALVKRVGGGRILVDFNHPLAGKKVSYDIEVLKKVTQVNDRVEAYIESSFGNIKHEFKEDILTIYLHTQIPPQIVDVFKEKIKEVIPEVKDVVFSVNSKNKDVTESNL